ncbi:MAG: WcaF family extracellular polysaccharide biosynthesis acetyltransferase [Bacteroidota bacterium]|jgi:putative colanic acid biosynthesis acetyltransferase WcaF
MRIETDLSKFNNDWYNPGSKIKLLSWFLVNSLIINNYLPIPVSLKIFVLRLFGAKIGHKVMIKPKVNIKYPWLLELGNYVWIGELVWIDNFVKVTIEDNSCISQGAMLLTGNHNYKKNTFDLIPGEIYLEKGVWIGAKSVVCGGVKCKSHAVLAVNSVATKDLKSYTIYQGNPAIEIRERVIFE